ncbi:TetR family transcriptional regulator [Lelliottia amnigena]|nr:TetR family transcriptional regulator [Lelliottia amnigena]
MRCMEGNTWHVRRVEDKRQALLEAATVAFAQSGIAASTALIARNAGVAEGTLFRYFATKDDLLNALYLHLKQDLCQTMLANLDRALSTPKEHTRNIWNSYVDWGIRNPIAHGAIRQLGVSEKINAETEQAVHDMFPELHELCRRSVRQVFMSDEFRTFGDAISCRLLRRRWPSPPAIRRVRRNLKPWDLNQCGERSPSRMLMDSKSLKEHAHRVALELPFIEHCWPFGPEYDVFKVGGKIFMLTAVAHGRQHVSLKSDPEKSLLNQQIYRGIEPGYHLNKKHWISIYAADDITPELVTDLVLDSWNLVVDKLPKKDQKRIRPT